MRPSSAKRYPNAVGWSNRTHYVDADGIIRQRAWPRIEDALTIWSTPMLGMTWWLTGVEWLALALILALGYQLGASVWMRRYNTTTNELCRCIERDNERREFERSLIADGEDA